MSNKKRRRRFRRATGSGGPKRDEFVAHLFSLWVWETTARETIFPKMSCKAVGFHLLSVYYSKEAVLFFQYYYIAFFVFVLISENRRKESVD